MRLPGTCGIFTEIWKRLFMETNSAKTARLVLILEAIAITTALILILVDYKLKNDLVVLYKKMEAALENGRKLFGESFGAGIDTSGLQHGPMVDNSTWLETPIVRNPDNANGQAAAADYKPPANRNRGNRNPQVPKPDKPVGS
jgi:hypothetical protein